MRHVRSLRILALFSGLALGACGSSGGGGDDAGAGADGATDGGRAGAGGKDGGTAGASGKDGGAGSDAAVDVAADTHGDTRSDVAPDVGAQDATEADASDAGIVTADLCAAIAVNAPAATVTNLNNGKTVDASAFSGGALAAGTYWLTSVTHFGGTYAGATQEIWVVGAGGKTLEDAVVAGTSPTYLGFTLTNKSASVLKGAPVCGGAVAATWNYTVTGAKLSVNVDGSGDVKIFTKQ